MSEIDEEETKKLGKTVYKHVEVQAAAGGEASPSRFIAQSHEEPGKKPAKRIKHIVGPKSSYSMITVWEGGKKRELQIAWWNKGPVKHLHCKNCGTNWYLADTNDYSRKFKLVGTRIKCKKCGSSGTYNEV
jgi:ribosomal protein S27AE